MYQPRKVTFYFVANRDVASTGGKRSSCLPFPFTFLGFTSCFYKYSSRCLKRAQMFSEEAVSPVRELESRG